MNHVIDPKATVPVVGLILASHWGYEQTNVDFYIVTEVKGAFCTIEEINAPEKPGATCLEGTKYPTLPVVVTGHGIRRKFKVCGDRFYVKVHNYASASPWSGEVEYVSHTH